MPAHLPSNSRAYRCAAPDHRGHGRCHRRPAGLTAVVPAASAAIIPIPADGPYGAATDPLVYAGGMLGWQITLIALAAALVAATAAVFLDRAWAGRRSVPTIK